MDVRHFPTKIGVCLKFSGFDQTKWPNRNSGLKHHSFLKPLPGMHDPILSSEVEGISSNLYVCNSQCQYLISLHLEGFFSAQTNKNTVQSKSLVQTLLRSSTNKYVQQWDWVLQGCVFLKVNSFAWFEYYCTYSRVIILSSCDPHDSVINSLCVSRVLTLGCTVTPTNVRMYKHTYIYVRIIEW